VEEPPSLVTVAVRWETDGVSVSGPQPNERARMKNLAMGEHAPDLRWHPRGGSAFLAIVSLAIALGTGSCGGSGGSADDDPLDVLAVQLPSGPALRLGQTLTLQVRESCSTVPEQLCPIDAVWSVTEGNAADAGEFITAQGSIVQFVTLRPVEFTLRATATDGSGRYGTRRISMAELEFDTRSRVEIPGGVNHDSILGADIVHRDNRFHLGHSVRGRLSALERYEETGTLELSENTDPTPTPASEQEAILDLAVAPNGQNFVITDGPGLPRTVTQFDPDFARVPGFVPPEGFAYLPAIAVDSAAVLWVGHGAGAAGVVKLSASGAILGELTLPSPLDSSLCALALLESPSGPTALYAADSSDLVRMTPDGVVDPTFTPPVFAGEILDITVDGLGRVFVAVQEIPDGQVGARGSIFVLNARGQIVKEVRTYDELVPDGNDFTHVERTFRHPMSIAANRNGVLWVYEDLTASAGAPNARLIELNPEDTIPLPSIVLTPGWYLLKPGWQREFEVTTTTPGFSPDYQWTAFNGDSVAGDGYVAPHANSSYCDFFAPATPGTYAVRVTTMIDGTEVSAEAAITVTAITFGFDAGATTPGADSIEQDGRIAISDSKIYLHTGTESGILVYSNTGVLERNDPWFVSSNRANIAVDTLGRAYYARGANYSFSIRVIGETAIQDRWVSATGLPYSYASTGANVIVEQVNGSTTTRVFVAGSWFPIGAPYNHQPFVAIMDIGQSSTPENLTFNIDEYYDSSFLDRWIVAMARTQGGDKFAIVRQTFSGQPVEYYCCYLTDTGGTLPLYWRLPTTIETVDDMAVDSNGLVYISDGTAVHILALSPTLAQGGAQIAEPIGSPIRSYGLDAGSGRTAAEFVEVLGIGMDHNDNLYVCDDVVNAIWPGIASFVFRAIPQ